MQGDQEKSIEDIEELKMPGDIGIYTPIIRLAKISKEVKRIKRLFRDMPKLTLDMMMKLINEAAFLSITLEETSKIIMRDGIIETYKNGANQCGMKKSSAVEVYDKFLNTYSKIVDQLCRKLPEEKQQNEAAEELLDFAMKHKKGS